MTPEKRRLYEKLREEANRQLDPGTPATERWVTVGGVGLCGVVAVVAVVPLLDFVMWPALVGLVILWLVDEFSARQAWRLYEVARSSGANRVALKNQRDALTRELFGRVFLLMAYFGGFNVFNLTHYWFLLLMVVAGFLYFFWLVFAFVRVEAQMRAAGNQ